MNTIAGECLPWLPGAAFLHVAFGNEVTQPTRHALATDSADQPREGSEANAT